MISPADRSASTIVLLIDTVSLNNIIEKSLYSKTTQPIAIRTIPIKSDTDKCNLKSLGPATSFFITASLIHSHIIATNTYPSMNIPK